jgi:hypothetical protein
MSQLELQQPIALASPKFDSRILVMGRQPQSPHQSSSQITIENTFSGNASAPSWEENSYPFRHWRCSSLLNEDAYSRVCNEFLKILAATDQEASGKLRFAKNIPKYDAYALAASAELARRFRPFFGDEFSRQIATFLGIPYCARVDGALHSNPPGARTGWIHTDLCSGWFDESNLPCSDDMLYPDRGRCEYFTGRAKSPGAQPVEYVRIASLLYFLGNDGWREGDGGETGLYAGEHDGPFCRKRLVPPLNNTAVLFLCSPHSYHRFVSNIRNTRNSIVMWLHLDAKSARATWGDAVRRGVS